MTDQTTRGGATGFGLWTTVRLLPRDAAQRGAVGKAVEDLGFESLWIGGSPGDLQLHEDLLAGSQRLRVASGIVEIWSNPAATVAASHQRVTRAYPGRFFLGLGAGHARMVEARGERYERPVAKLRAYLDELDAARPPVAPGERILAALGPKVLQLSAERAAGAHPYCTNAAHTAQARALMGPSALLFPDQKVYFGTDASTARDVARKGLAIYLGLPNYVNNFRRMGFDDGDFSDGGSDRLLDTLVAWGPDEAVTARLREHLDAGATEVLVQVLTAEDAAPGTPPLDAWRHAAEALLS
jgi:probable F420-dependent oxidoreductase